MWPQRSSRLWLLQAKERLSGFDQGDPGAEARKCLSEFDADGAPAENRQRRGQLSRNRRLTVGPELDGVETWEGGDRRGAAVGDHHRATRDEPLASDLYGAQVGQLPFPSKE